MSPNERSVLIGAADGEFADRFEQTLRQQMVRSQRVSAGPQIIEQALFERFDAIVLDTSLSLLDPRQVRDLLRTNPRTRSIHVYLIDLAGTRPKDSELIQQPHADLSWLSAALPTIPQAASDGQVSADLTEVQLPDLVQMLIQNQRTGVAQVESNGRMASIEIAQSGFGRIQLDQHDGLKALARVLVWETGTFKFRPREDVEAAPAGDPLGLLLDAVRLADEAENLRQQIPPGSRLVITSKRGAAPDDPVLEEVLMLVDFYGAVDDILERVKMPDAEVLATILRLRDEGWVDIRLPSATEAGGSGAWPDILAGEHQDVAQHPIVWILGTDADYVRVLWSDSRVQERILTRKSLRNGGRFGGNGWFIDIGGNRFVWCRFLPPCDLLSDFAMREDLTHIGMMLLNSQLGAEDMAQMVETAHGFDDAGLAVVWLSLDHANRDSEAVGAEQPIPDNAPGTRLPVDQDTPGLFWRALESIFAHH